MANPDWEIDTRHLGFESWREAACFANGLTEDGACALLLYEGVLLLQLVNGRDVIVDAHDVVVWQRERAPDECLPEDSAFIRTALDFDELSAIGLDGAFRPMRFGVDDLHGSARLDVRVEADARRRTVLVTLAATEHDGESSGDMFGGAIFDVPRA